METPDQQRFVRKLRQWRCEADDRGHGTRLARQASSRSPRATIGPGQALGIQGLLFPDVRRPLPRLLQSDIRATTTAGRCGSLGLWSIGPQHGSKRGPVRLGDQPGRSRRTEQLIHPWYTAAVDNPALRSTFLRTRTSSEASAASAILTSSIAAAQRSPRNSLDDCLAGNTKVATAPLGQASLRAPTASSACAGCQPFDNRLR